jgi:hypothetical protein
LNQSEILWLQITGVLQSSNLKQHKFEGIKHFESKQVGRDIH